MKVKIFSKCGGYFSKSSKISLHLEQEINTWLESHPGIKIIKIKKPHGKQKPLLFIHFGLVKKVLKQ